MLRAKVILLDSALQAVNALRDSESFHQCNNPLAHCFLYISPKPGIPPPEAYNPPPPPSNRELGPPPPGYNRFGEFDRPPPTSFGAGRGVPADGFVPRRNLDEVMCYKVRSISSRSKFELTLSAQCGEKGHYANHCRNRNVPGNRGGMDRGPRKYGDNE